jgi:hypothetical protein
MALRLRFSIDTSEPYVSVAKHWAELAQERS